MTPKPVKKKHYLNFANKVLKYTKIKEMERYFGLCNLKKKYSYGFNLRK